LPTLSRPSIISKGKAKVMSYEDIVEAQANAKEAAVVKGKTRSEAQSHCTRTDAGQKDTEE